MTGEPFFESLHVQVILSEAWKADRQSDPSSGQPSRRSYRIWSLMFKRSCRLTGNLILESSRTSEGIRLRIEQIIASHQTAFRTNAVLECAPDSLATLRSWKWRSCALNDQGQEIPLTALNGTGTRQEMALPPNSTGALVSNWSLFEAVPHLSPSLDWSHEFEMLEDLHVLRPAQRIVPLGVQEVEINGLMHRLRIYLHTGTGTVPHRYWVDEHDRLVFCLAARRLLVLAPESIESDGNH